MNEDAPKIRELNDSLRKTLSGGRVVTTPSVLAHDDFDQIMDRVRRFSDFDSDNDPYGEHDFGSITMEDGQKIFWKIDYYDATDMNQGSTNPSDPAVTIRVLTVMLAEEY